MDPNRLRALFTWYHEDWMLDAETPDAVLEQFIRSNTDAEVKATADALEAFLAALTRDAELRHALTYELWCRYVPEADGMTVRGWLLHVLARLRSSGAAAGPA